MSLIRQTSLSPLSRLLLAAALVCALLVSQFTLNRHVVEHASVSTLVAAQADNDAGAPDGPSCLMCLEHQAHGSALTAAATLAIAATVAVLLARALPPNVPYLAPERARQRAPPVFS